MIREYTLIDVSNAPNVVIVDINEVNDSNNPIQDKFMPEETPQSKVKESKVKDSKDICAPDGARAQHMHSSPGGSVEAEKVTATPDGDKLSEKSGPRSPFKSKRQEQLFDEFWAQYPKKRSKGQAEKTWVKLKPDEQLFKAIMAGLERAKTSVDWQKDGGQYIPYPSTWLNAKGWEDEYTPTLTVVPKGWGAIKEFLEDGG